MRLPPRLLLACILVGFVDLVVAFPQPAGPAVPQPARRHTRPGKRFASDYPNPLVASRQVKADSLRGPQKAKRACPSFLPNGNCACPGTETYCSASASCVNLQTNSENCGACGTACPQGMGCFEGSCSQCDPDSASPDFCSGRCTNTQIDSRNCGTCGTICPTGTTCMGGGCACETTHGYAVCDNVCVNTETYLTDPDNCGACGFVCNTGTLECSGGDCVCDTANGYVSCNGNCVSSYFFTYSGANCGSCGHVCQSPTSGCLNSECVCPQGTSYTPCGDDCYDLTSDISNCGTCGHACPSSSTCTDSTCVCDEGYTLCGGLCLANADFASDSANCGQCGTVCASGTTCQSSICFAQNVVIGFEYVTGGGIICYLMDILNNNGMQCGNNGGIQIFSPTLNAGPQNIILDNTAYPFWLCLTTWSGTTLNPTSGNYATIDWTGPPLSPPGSTPVYTGLAGQYYETDVWTLTLLGNDFVLVSAEWQDTPTTSYPLSFWMFPGEATPAAYASADAAFMTSSGFVQVVPVAVPYTG